MRSGLAKHRATIRRQAEVERIVSREMTLAEQEANHAFWQRVRELNEREDREKAERGDAPGDRA